jgi:bacteriocin-like protein
MKKQQERLLQNPAYGKRNQSVQELTDEQLQLVIGGLNPQLLPSGLKEPPDPCIRWRMGQYQV